jgi:hypothetical protein
VRSSESHDIVQGEKELGGSIFFQNPTMIGGRRFSFDVFAFASAFLFLGGVVRGSRPICGSQKARTNASLFCIDQFGCQSAANESFVTSLSKRAWPAKARNVPARKNASPHQESIVSTLKIPPGGGQTNANNKVQVLKNGQASELTARSSFSFPIQIAELPQFACMSTMMFLFIYVFTTVRDTKDALVVSKCGAEAIPFLKLYGVMPCATLFIVIYSKMSNIFADSKESLFYLTLLPFFVFYTIFAFVLYPMRDVIHFESTTTTISNAAGGASSAAFALLRYWSFSLYFIVSELWASAGIPLLFWTCANDVTRMEEAKRFYPLFAVVGNLAPILSGKVMASVVAMQKSSDDVGFGRTLKILVSRGRANISNVTSCRLRQLMV